jgi:hypothetical protein
MSEVIPVASYGEIVSDDALDLRQADAIATALEATSETGSDVFYLPRPLADEKILEPEEGADCVFVAELLPERETGDAYYAKQGPGGVWLPKSTTRIYVVAQGADIYVPDAGQETEGSA